MNLGEEFIQGRIACEVDGCTETATVSVKDFGRLYGQGPFPIELVQIGPIHFLCNLHKTRQPFLEKVDGEWVRD